MSPQGPVCAEPHDRPPLALTEVRPPSGFSISDGRVGGGRNQVPIPRPTRVARLLTLLPPSPRVIVLAVAPPPCPAGPARPAGKPKICPGARRCTGRSAGGADRKSTRLNSSHA